MYGFADFQPKDRAKMTSRRTAILLAYSAVALLACGPKDHTASSSPQVTTSEASVSVPSSSFAPALLPRPLQSDPMGVTIHRLSNGLTVYISTERATPSISSWIAVRSGSRHDPANSTGLAHYLEHMLFKGTGKLGTLDFAQEKPHLERIAALYDELRAADAPEKRTEILAGINKETLAGAQFAVPNEFDNLYASLGIDGVNAFTSDEQTVYIATVPQNQFASWANVEGERFSDPQFRLFYPELESVYEEKNRSLDSPQSRIFEALTKALFPKHPYGAQPTIGHAEHLKAPAYADMVQYFDRWYRPNNMAILLAGDIDAETALPILEKAFGGLQAKELPALPPASLEVATTRQEVEIKAPGEQAIFIAWPTVPAGHIDELALRAMDLIVDNSATGLLNLELVLSQKLPSAGSFPQTMVEAGMWVITGTARDDQSLEEVESLLMGVVSKLKAGTFTQADLDAIVINYEISEKRELESNDNRVSKLSSAFIEGRAWPAVVSEAERMAAITREDIMRVANQYLSDAPVVIKRVRGDFNAEKVAKPSISPIEIDSSRQSPYAKEIKAAPVEPLKPEWLVEGTHYVLSDLPAGAFIAVNNPRNDLFEIHYDFKVGEQQEPLLCYALELIERSGAGDKSPTELQRALYAIGSSIQFGCGSRESRITISGVDRKMEESLDILKAWLATPRIEADALDKLFANTVSKRKDAMNEPRVIAQALAAYALLGKNSDFLRVPSNKQLDAASSKKLIALAAELPNIQHRTSYFGPRTADVLKERIALGKAHKAPKEATAIRFTRVKTPTLFFIDQKVAQAQVRIGFAAIETAKDERIKASLFNQFVGGGMGGLVFQEIREARGLAYSAFAYYDASSRKRDGAAIIAGLGTQADKTVEALTTMLSLIAPLNVEATRFQTSVASLDADYRKARIEPRQIANVVQSWQDLGFAQDPRPERFAALHTTSAEEMQTFTNQLTREPPVIAISGDSDRIDMKALETSAGIGSTKRLTVAELFGF